MLKTCVRRMAIVAAAASLAACSGPSAEKSLAAAKAHLAKQALPEAIIELNNTLQANPSLAEARLLLGKTLLEREDPVGAAVELQKAVGLGVAADDVVPPLARALVQSGQARKVIELDRTGAVKAPAAVADLKTSVAIAYAQEGQDEKAQQALSSALEASPEYAPALLLRARSLAGRRDLDAALRLVEGVLARDASDADAWLLAGELQWARGDQPAAMDSFNKALKARPSSVAAHSALIGRLLDRADVDAAKTQLAALQSVRPRHPRTLYFEARVALQTGDLKAAVERTERLLKALPDSPAVLELAGTLAMRSNEPLRAEAHFAKLVQVQPQQAYARHQLARVYLDRNEPDKTLQVLAPLLNAVRPEPETLSIAGRAELQRGETRRAEELLARATAARPDDVSGRTALAAARLARGEAKGLSELQELAATSDAATADHLLVSAALNRRDFGAALKAIDGLERKQPGNAQPLQLRGDVLRLKGDLAGARAAFDAALALRPGYFPAVDALAQLDLRERRPAAARARFEALLTAEPKNARAMLALAELDTREGKPKEVVADRLKAAVAADPALVAARERLVDFHLAQRDTKAALTAAQEAAAAFSDSAQIALLLGRAHQAAGETQQALSAFNRSAALAPKVAAPLLAMAAFHASNKNVDAALDSMRRAVSLEPDNAEVLRRAVALNLTAGRPDGARAIVKALQARAPRSALGFELTGDIEMRRRDWAAATAAYRQALQLQPTTVGAIRLHEARAAAGDRQGAEAVASAWLKDHADDAAFLLFLGSAASRAGDEVKAEARYRQALALQPDNPAALNNLAWSLGQQKKPGGLELAERANALAPNQPLLMDTLALALADAGRLGDAVELQTRVVALAPEQHSFRLTLAGLLLRADRREEARRHLDALAALGDAFPRQSEVRALQARQ